MYRSPAFRAPDLRPAGVRRYLEEQFAAEEDVECWFRRPIAAGDYGPSVAQGVPMRRRRPKVTTA